MPPKLPPKKPYLKEQALALYDYNAENEDELTIKEGDIITIISKEVEDEGWWKGELHGKVGVFPDNYVEIIKIGQTNLNSSNNNQSLNNHNSLLTSLTKNSSNSNLNNLALNNNQSFDETVLKFTKKPVPENKLTKVLSSFTGTGTKLSDIISKVNSNTQENKNNNNNNTTLTKQNSNDKSNINNLNTSAPSLPLKKPKVFTSQKSQKQEKSPSEEILNNSASDNDLNSIIDSQQNSIKLTHLTAKRVKGPRDRRPPSIVQVPKEDENSLTSSSSLCNISDLVNSLDKTNRSTDNELDEKNWNKETIKQSFKNGSSNETLKSTQANITNLSNQQNVPWMVELKKTQEKKNEVKKKVLNLNEESVNGSNVINNCSKLSMPIPNSPTKSTSNHRMSGDFTQRFKEFQQSPIGTNSLSRHSSVNNSSNFSRTLSTDSLDNKESSPGLGFGNLSALPPCFVPALAPAPVKPAKAAKPSSTKYSSTPNNPSTLNNNFGTNNNQSKDSFITKKEFQDLQKKVHDLSDALDNQKQVYKNLIKDLINDLAEEKKKVANLIIEVDRLRKLTTTV